MAGTGFSPPQAQGPPFLLAAATVAATSPWLLAYNLPPSSTMLNQLLALAAWGMVLLGLGVAALHSRRHSARVSAQGAPPQGASSQGALARVLMGSLLLAALVSAGVAALQVLAPDFTRELPGGLIAPSTLPGRGVGNIRQPNHLASLLVWGAVAWVVLAVEHSTSFKPTRVDAGAAPPGIPTVPLWCGMALLMLGVVLSGSRTGLVSVLCLAVWGLADRRLIPLQRRALMAAPLLCAAAWLLMLLWSHSTGLPFGAADHLQQAGQGDLSSSRFAIWRNTLTLIAAHPWTGVGWGEFNFAWTLTPMAHRPPALFDHSHNIVLQFLVELGIPLGGALLIALAVLLRAALHRAWRAQGEQAAMRRGAGVMLLLVALHSLLEYPLWYAYFLFPTLAAWVLAWGPDSGNPPAASVGAATKDSGWAPVALVVAGAGLVVSALVAFADYRMVSQIYEPARNADPLAVRMGRGQNALWFGPQADYAVATMTPVNALEPWPDALTRAFSRSSHVLLDTRLMMAWAKALAARNSPGDLDRARHIADRLREFNNPQAREWLGICEQVPQPEPRPFQCEPPAQRLDWRDFKQPIKQR